MEHLAGRLGDVTFVVCLDAGGGDYERLWLTSSLRGVVQVTVTVRVLEAAQHSGMASGIVPSSFRIMRELLDRVEDSATGEVKLSEMNVTIPGGAPRRGASGRRFRPRRGQAAVPAGRGHADGLRRRYRAHPEQHLAADAVGDRRGRAARAR